MFVRKKKNKSGTVSLQIIDKSSGCYRVAKTAGSFSAPGIRDENIKTFFDEGLSSYSWKRDIYYLVIILIWCFSDNKYPSIDI